MALPLCEAQNQYSQCETSRNNVIIIINNNITYIIISDIVAADMTTPDLKT